MRRAVAEEFAEQGYISVPVGDVHLHADYATVEVGKSVAVVELGESGWRMIALRTTKTSR